MSEKRASVLIQTESESVDTHRCIISKSLVWISLIEKCTPFYSEPSSTISLAGWHRKGLSSHIGC